MAPYIVELSSNATETQPEGWNRIAGHRSVVLVKKKKKEKEIEVEEKNYFVVQIWCQDLRTR